MANLIAGGSLRVQVRATVFITTVFLLALTTSVDAQQPCPGDCNGNGRVEISELIRGVTISLGLSAIEDCLAMDGDGNGRVGINELIRGVAAALNGCPPPPSTATPTETPSVPSSTPTITFTPTITATSTATFTPSSTPTPTIPPLQLGIEINPNPPVPSELIQVVFNVANRGATRLGNVRLSLVVPAGLAAFAGGLTEGGTCPAINCVPGSTLSWTFDSVPAGSGVSVSIATTIAANTLPDTEIRFDARLTADGAPSASSVQTVVVAAARALDLGLDEDRDPVGAGEELTYTVTFGNRSAALAPDTVIELPLPLGTSLVSASGDPSVVDGVVSWDVGTLSPGQGGTRQVTVETDADLRLGEVVVAQAEIGAASEGTGLSRATAVTRVESGVPVALAMEINPDPVQPGEMLQAVVSIANQTLVSVNADLGLRIPAQLSFFAAGLTEGGACGTVNCAAPQRLVWTLDDIGAGAGRSVSLMPTLAMVPNGSVVPFEVLLRGSAGQWRRLRRSVVVETGRNLDLGLDEDRDPVGAGEELTYTVTFGNRSAALAPDTVIELPLPLGTSLVSATGDPSVVDGVVSWDVGTLSPGQGGTRQVTVETDADLRLGEVVVAQAEIGAASEGTDLSRATAVTRVESGVPVLLAMEINPQPVNQGQMLAVRLSAQNLAPVSSSISLHLRIPSQVLFFPASSTGGGVCGTVNCAAPQRVNWQFPMVLSNAEVFVQVPPTVAAVPDGAIIPFESVAMESSGRWRRLRRSVLVE